MQRDIVSKIQRAVGRGREVSEDEVRSLAILVRKRLELMGDADRASFLTLNLFCNWMAHTAITESVTGLRTLARVNDALVRVSGSQDTNEITAEMWQAIGFDTLHSELTIFLQEQGISHELDEKKVWAAFLDHIIEIIRDVPLAFPPVGELKGAARKIYDQVVRNPVKPGAGVVSVVLSQIDYGAVGVRELGERLCLVILTEDTTKLVVPL